MLKMVLAQFGMDPTYLVSSLLKSTWNNIVLQDFKKLLSDIVLTHTVLQSQVELVAAVEHLLAVVVLGPEAGNQSICGEGNQKIRFI